MMVNLFNLLVNARNLWGYVDALIPFHLVTSKCSYNRKLFLSSYINSSFEPASYFSLDRVRTEIKAQTLMKKVEDLPLGKNIDLSKKLTTQSDFYITLCRFFSIYSHLRVKINDQLTPYLYNYQNFEQKSIFEQFKLVKQKWNQQKQFGKRFSFKNINLTLDNLLEVPSSKLLDTSDLCRNGLSLVEQELESNLSYETSSEGISELIGEFSEDNKLVTSSICDLAKNYSENTFNDFFDFIKNELFSLIEYPTYNGNHKSLLFALSYLKENPDFFDFEGKSDYKKSKIISNLKYFSIEFVPYIYSDKLHKIYDKNLDYVYRVNHLMKMFGLKEHLFFSLSEYLEQSNESDIKVWFNDFNSFYGFDNNESESSLKDPNLRNDVIRIALKYRFDDLGLVSSLTNNEIQKLDFTYNLCINTLGTPKIKYRKKMDNLFYSTLRESLVEVEDIQFKRQIINNYCEDIVKSIRKDPSIFRQQFGLVGGGR